MTKIIIFLNCILLFLSCASPCYKENNVLNAKNQYEHYLSEYYMNGDVSNIDSALKYNAEILNTDSASIVHYLNQIQLHYLCRQYDSILSFVDRIPQGLNAKRLWQENPVIRFPTVIIWIALLYFGNL